MESELDFLTLNLEKNQNNGEEIVNYFNSKHYKATFKKIVFLVPLTNFRSFILFELLLFCSSKEINFAKSYNYNICNNFKFFLDTFLKKILILQRNSFNLILLSSHT